MLEGTPELSPWVSGPCRSCAHDHDDHRVGEGCQVVVAPGAAEPHERLCPCLNEPDEKLRDAREMS